ncbi:MAG: hypothetical protein EHM84_04675 [Lysobacterales bacterium]|jgi:hypothetical protein|nr:MAG: hypothetical protein EHM84_04675 [Xanthomonadales bacterium]
MSSESVVSPDPERLAGLVFELASQLHIERTQRIALEIALARSGALDLQRVEGLAGDAELRRRSAAELDQSMAKLMRVLKEHADQRRPLPIEAEPARRGH